MRQVRVLAALSAAALLAVAMAGCGAATGSPSPTYTEVPIGATAWPNGTTGHYGLHIDPSLLGRAPRFAGAIPILEDAQSELGAMDDADLAKNVDRYVAAAAGEVGDDDWMNLAIAHFKVEDISPDVYTAWVDEYATGACSQADGVTAQSQSTIGNFIVDTAICGGGIRVFTLSLGGGVLLSLYDFGPKEIGRKMIEAMY